jgi:hypothetical protein
MRFTGMRHDRRASLVVCMTSILLRSIVGVAGDPSTSRRATRDRAASTPPTSEKGVRKVFPQILPGATPRRVPGPAWRVTTLVLTVGVAAGAAVLLLGQAGDAY